VFMTRCGYALYGHTHSGIPAPVACDCMYAYAYAYACMHVSASPFRRSLCSTRSPRFRAEMLGIKSSTGQTFGKVWWHCTSPGYRLGVLNWTCVVLVHTTYKQDVCAHHVKVYACNLFHASFLLGTFSR
jgi:zona occludens toxin (predicted ATPase)